MIAWVKRLFWRIVFAIKYPRGRLPDKVLDKISDAIEEHDIPHIWHPTAEQLMDWEAGCASEEDATRVDQHLSRCSDCRELLTEAECLDNST